MRRSLPLLPLLALLLQLPAQAATAEDAAGSGSGSGSDSSSSSSSSCVAPAADPANTYDAAHTYAKLVRNYPFIGIASSELPADVRKIADQTYARHGAHCLQLDLYLPAKAQVPVGAALPVVVFVHGGGWRSGYRAEFVPLALRLAQRGIAAATISYRLADEARYPAAVHDARAAVRWVRAHAGQYGLDPVRIALAGGSAGGQIASLAGVTGHLDAFDPGAATSDVSSAVQAIVNIDGLSDFTSEAARQNEDDPLKKPSAAGFWFGGRYAEKPALWREASPIQYVRPGMPPILFIGSAQARFSVGRDEMVARMTQAGVSSRVLLLPDTPHSFWMFDPWLQPTLDAMVAFLAPQAASSAQSAQSYDAALQNLSTSPSYVQIAIADSATAPPRTICTSANFLLGAIHKEYGLAYDAEGSRKALELARQRADHRFIFRQPAAIANIPVRYSDTDLAAARALLAPYSTEQLKLQFSSLLGKSRLSTGGYARDAVACVLIERGLAPKLSDISGQVYLAP